MENTRYRHPPLQGKIYKSAIVWLQALLLALAGTCTLVLAVRGIESVREGEAYALMVVVLTEGRGSADAVCSPCIVLGVEDIVGGEGCAQCLALQE